MASAKDTVEIVRTSWGSTNDGEGTGMDSDLLDGKSSEYFLTINTGTDCNAMVDPGFYSGQALTNNPSGSVSSGSVIVTRGDGTTSGTQTYIDSNTKMYLRYGAGTPVVWQPWNQLGIMTFDGVRLRITL